MTDPARELADLRAWLAVALRMVHREAGAAGLATLTVPSDRELIDDVRRLRKFADDSEAVDDQSTR